MPVPVMDIGQVVMFMFLGGMFMLMRMDSVQFVMCVSEIAVPMAVLVKYNRMHV